jgi:hypothetical protein
MIAYPIEVVFPNRKDRASEVLEKAKFLEELLRKNRRVDYCAQ